MSSLTITTDENELPLAVRCDFESLCANLESLAEALQEIEDSGDRDLLPTFQKVRNAETSKMREALVYTHDGLDWWGEIGIGKLHKMSDGKCATERKLSIYLPNVGNVYPSESLFPVQEDKSDLTNNNHQDCPLGWAVLDSKVWTHLAPFKAWARKWFGYTDGQQLKTQVVLNVESERIDISFKCFATNVIVSFCFEPGFPDSGLF
ncbi:MAG: hypothetical protein SGARI_006619, partial [Bacillariaceae sp.]